MFSDRLWRTAALLASLAAATGCELGEEIVSPGAAELVVHAVLSSTAITQTILLERSWDGINYIWKTGQEYTTANPIIGGAGYPEILADVEVETPDGTVIRASEAQLVNIAFGPGLYLLPLPGSSLVPGGTYRLRIRSSAGEELTAATTVPVFSSSIPLEQTGFDRMLDTLWLTWPRVAGAPAYHVIVDTPYGTSTFFSDTTAIRLLGTLRNVTAEGLPHVFIPGFTQTVTVAAVDSNYYSYFRSGNHSQIGSGLLNRVAGGLGVFGVAMPVVRRQLQVVAPFREALEGNYRYLGTPGDSARTLIVGLTVYVESRASRSGIPDAVSGRYLARPGVLPQSQLTGALLGSRWRDSLQLVFLTNQRITDTLEVFRARVAGDTITGSYRFRSGTWRFLKQD